MLLLVPGVPLGVLDREPQVAGEDELDAADILHHLGAVAVGMSVLQPPCHDPEECLLVEARDDILIARGERLPAVQLGDVLYEDGVQAGHDEARSLLVPDRAVQIAPDALAPRGEFDERKDAGFPFRALRLYEPCRLLLDRAVDDIINVMEIVVKCVARDAAGGHDVADRDLTERLFLREIECAVDDGAFGEL